MSARLLNCFFAVGKLVAPLYSLVMRLRAFLYNKGFFASEQLALPVVSVGNLTMGGTGKTPVVMYVARLLAAVGRPAVISRGYGGKGGGAVNIVSDGSRVLLSPEIAGDEPVLLARSLPGIPVITGAKRSVTGRYVQAHKLADVVVMDDGFQHLALARDLDLVLFSGSELLGNGWVFPGGVLREPVSALERADAFVITGVTGQNQDKVAAFKRRLGQQFVDTPVFEVIYRLSGFAVYPDPDGLGSVSAAELKNTKLFAVCGIAKPEPFLAMLDAEGLQICGFKVFADHHSYSAADLESVCRMAHESGGEGLVVTEKDFVKLQGLAVSMPVWVAQLSLTVGSDFDRFVLDRIAKG